MEVFKYLFQMYNNKQSLVRQISLFSLIGLMVIFFNNFASGWLNLFFENFYINPPASELVVKLSLGLAIFICVYLIGYTYKFIRGVSQNGKAGLPDFDLEPFALFIRMIPMALIWTVNYLIIFLAGSFVLHKFSTSPNNYLFYSLMICLIPFILIIFAKFAGDFKYQQRYFSFSYFVKVIDKSLGDVIFLSLEIIIPAVLIVAAIYAAFMYSAHIKSDIWLFGVRYFIICLSIYLFIILQYTYFTGLTKIAGKPTLE